MSRQRDRGSSTDVMIPSYLTPQQVADMLQVDERTVLRWAQQDASMPTTRIGRVVRFEKAALDRWLARKRPRSAQGSTQTAVAAP
jgi:excisionase family DNA binding protein